MHVEFVPAGVNKGAALVQLCQPEHLDLPLEAITAFGDNNNDVEMLKVVGQGVAMANAVERVKATADRVSVWSNVEDGVARELESMGLTGAKI